MADSEVKIEYLILPEGVVRQFAGQLRLLPIDVLLPGVMQEDQSRHDPDTDKAGNEETSKSTQEDFPDLVDRNWQQPGGAPCDGGET
jgi:hypothetical protein